jgi:DNA polymerase I-like protein with 3'-5' exonuclease and polymerase domains
VEKDAARDRILAGAPYSEEDKEYIMSYCESDVLETSELFQRMITVPDFDIPTSLFRGEYMKSVAEIEYYGMPIDTDSLNELQENWEKIKFKLIKNIDKFGIYEGTSFRINNFEILIQINNWVWPRTDTGLPKIDKETFKEMAEIHPEIGPLKELKALIGGLNFKSIMAGSDCRSRTLISPFWTKTGRNAPKDDEEKKNRGELRVRFMFGLPASLRSLIKPNEGKVLAYIDYAQQEFFIAAVLSNDPNMIEAYKSGDPYLAFAKLAGAVPEDSTKETHGSVRQLFKSCVLGVQYGLGAESLGFKIGKPTPYAKELLSHHKRVFKNYWCWVDMTWTQACLMKRIETCYKWKMIVSGCSNKEMLTVRNFPIQATGAEILRVACILLSENKIKIVAPVHDALMIECDEKAAEADEEIEIARKLMCDASEIVLGAGNRLKTDVDIVCYPDRYIDEKGAETWELITRILMEIKQE